MKAIFLACISGIWLISCSGNLSSNDVPSLVVNAVQLLFPAAEHIEWEEKKNFFEAEFTVDSTKHSLHIDRSGKLLQRKTEITAAQVPNEIADTILSNYPGYEIDDISIIDRSGKISYEIELDAKNSKDIELLLSEKGQIIINR